VGRRLVGDRVQSRWLAYGLTQCLESGLFDLWVNVMFHLALSLIQWSNRISNDSVKWLDNQIIWFWISTPCLIIKGLDNQAQKLNYHLNQYPKKSLIVSLELELDCIFRNRPSDNKYQCMSNCLMWCVGLFSTVQFLLKMYMKLSSQLFSPWSTKILQVWCVRINWLWLCLLFVRHRH